MVLTHAIPRFERGHFAADNCGEFGEIFNKEIRPVSRKLLAGQRSICDGTCRHTRGTAGLKITVCVANHNRLLPVPSLRTQYQVKHVRRRLKRDTIAALQLIKEGGNPEKLRRTQNPGPLFRGSNRQTVPLPAQRGQRLAHARKEDGGV